MNAANICCTAFFNSLLGTKWLMITLQLNLNIKNAMDTKINISDLSFCEFTWPFGWFWREIYLCCVHVPTEGLLITYEIFNYYADRAYLEWKLAPWIRFEYMPQCVSAYEHLTPCSLPPISILSPAFAMGSLHLIFKTYACACVIPPI